MRKMYLLLFPFSLVGIVYSAGSDEISTHAFSRGERLSAILTDQKVVLCDEDLRHVLQLVQDFSDNNDIVVSHIGELNDKYANQMLINYDYFSKYIELLSLLLIDLIQFASPENIQKSNKLFIDISNRLVSDVLVFSQALSIGEKEKLLHPVYNVFFSFIKESFATCMSDNLVINQGDWKDLVPYFNAHSQICDDVLYIIEVTDSLSYFYNHYCHQAFSSAQVLESWKKFINSGCRNRDIVVCNQVSGLNIFFDNYYRVLFNLLSWPFYAYTNRAVLPMLRLVRKDFTILSEKINLFSLSENVAKLKKMVLDAAQEKLDNTTKGASDFSDNHTYCSTARWTAHELALDQLRVLSNQCDEIFKDL